ncbi:hypothetical protein FEM48_Zijuj07G0009900 [Ziziphus jujuba var. spinosa]|uniref:DUF4220 domain-containing protein n=1 Tax=Ziziphus jujuba var. spinosa TaxID=714518 RepID=A0A978V1I5_ZIZJJ|nr:hypothetical protein FEM48_Zijuj07G0009900 [Ziziphus jujuba var. spinosa]
MQIPLYKSVTKLWDAWNLRGFVLLSLCLQTLLVLFAPFRKRTANKLVIIIIWSAYSLSDWAATFAIGLMSSSSSSSGVKDDHNQYHDVSDSLKGFWAPFLLFHLGGPDNITAFALEDNELWLRKNIQQFFLSTNAEEAYLVIEAELNFIYDAFYTKAVVVHTKKGYIFRTISMGLLMISLIYFSLIEKRDFIHKSDVHITYVLLVDALCLDAIALLMRILSDWTVMAFENESSSFLAKSLQNFISFKWFSRFRSYTSIEHGSKYYLVMVMRFLFRRWSETVPGFSFTSYNLNKTQSFGLSENFVYGLVFKNISNNNKPLTINQWRIIFLELHQKSLATGDNLETAWNIFLSRGEWVLEKYNSNLDSNILEILLSSVTDGDGDGDYDESIMMWHFATELCYYTEEEDQQDHDHDYDQYRECSKLISDYLLYLLVKKPKMISSVAGIAKGKFQETCEEATKFFGQKELSSPEEYYIRGYDRIIAWTEASEEIPSMSNNFQFEGGSVFSGACCLAKTLRELGNKKWEITCKVLVEMLCYAASHCRALIHYRQLSEGGQLLTFVWLLMIHFGLWEIYQTSERSSKPE